MKMENINYEELIDKLCIPSIKILRENLKVNTLFCCQGKECKESHHSNTGYISAELNDRSEKVFISLAKQLSMLYETLPNCLCSIEYRYSYTPRITLRLKRLYNEEKLRTVWAYIEKILKRMYEEENNN